MGAFDDLIPEGKKPPGQFDDLVPNTTAGDVLKSGAAGAVQGLGAIAQGGGNIIAQAVNRGSEALTGYNPMLRAEDPLKAASDAILDSRTEGGKRAMELSTPDGDITKPDTWTLGQQPSIGGYLQQGANVLGQFVGPGAVGAAAKVGKITAGAQEALGAIQGGLQAGGAAAAQEGEAIRTAKHDKLFAESQAYRDYLAKGMSPGDAKERTALDVEGGAGTIGALPAAAEGAVLQGLLRGRLKMPTFGKGVIARAASAIGGGAVAEGIQEGVEGVAQKVGANVGGGMDQSLTEGSFQNVVLGAIGGAAGGGAIHAISGDGKAKDGSPGEPAAPPQLALPAPGNVAIRAGEGGSTPAFTEADAQAEQVYAARAKREAELAQFASNGAISTAAAIGMGNGAVQTAAEKRQADIQETLNPAQPLALPAPVGEKEKLEQAKTDEYLANKDSMSLTEAQAVSFKGVDRGHDLTVVPHPSGQGYTTIPTRRLSDRQAKAVESIQRPDQGQLPSPNSEKPGAWVAPEGRTPEAQTYGNDPVNMRVVGNQWRKDMGTPTPRPIPPQRPIDDAKKAAQIAERKTQDTGREHEVVPHPFSSNKFAVAPVPQTIEGQATRVVDQPKGAASAAQEATSPQRQSASVSNDQADGARPGEAAPGAGVAAEAAQDVAPKWAENDYAHIKDLDISYDVHVQDSGETASVTENAAEAMRSLDKRKSGLDELMRCVMR